MAYREAGNPQHGSHFLQGNSTSSNQVVHYDHPHVIVEEAPRVAELCIGSDMGTMSTVTVFTEMKVGSVI